MMKIKLLILLIPLFLLTGCWNYNELNDLAISTALAIDKDNDQYEVSLLIANSKKAEVSSQEGESQTIIYTGKGKTISEAFKKIDLVSPKKLYIGHLSVIVLSDELAKQEGVNKIMDFLLREPESVKRFYLILAKGHKAKDVIKILSPLESFPSQNIYRNIKISNETQSVSTSIYYSEFVDKLLSKGIEPILPSIKIEGDVKQGSKSESLNTSDPESKLKMGATGIFKDGKLIKYVSITESRGINLIQNNVDSMIIVAKCKGGNAIANVDNIKTKIKVQKNKIKVKTTASAYLKEANCKENLYDEKNIKKFEKNFEKKIKYFMKKGLKIAQKNKTDIFGFGNLIYKRNPHYFNKYENIWNDEKFPKIKPKFEVNMNLRSKGSTEKTIMEALHER